MSQHPHPPPTTTTPPATAGGGTQLPWHVGAACAAPHDTVAGAGKLLVTHLPPAATVHPFSGSCQHDQQWSNAAAGTSGSQHSVNVISRSCSAVLIYPSCTPQCLVIAADTGALLTTTPTQPAGFTSPMQMVHSQRPVSHIHKCGAGHCCTGSRVQDQPVMQACPLGTA
jgi:hypothetical protein